MNLTSEDLSPPGSLGLRGAPNFRDLGGYRTLDGRMVSKRRLFRSNHLGHLTDEDRALVASLSIRSVCDLRGRWEREQAAPMALPDVQLHVCEIEPAIVPRLRALPRLDDSVQEARAAEEVVIEVYRDYAHDGIAAMRKLFALLLDDAVPLVFHCAAGKDRTGVAAALVLSALGVPRPTVLHDYLLSRLFWREAAQDHPLISPTVVRVAGGVQACFLDATLATIDTAYGGMSSYLELQLGLDAAARRQLAALYLTP